MAKEETRLHSGWITKALVATPVVQKAIFACLLSLALTACETAPDAASPVVIPVSANAGPGSIIPSDADAVRFFKGACISGRTFERAPTYLATQPVVRNSRTGTYYHQRFDMSVKINKDRCSIVSAAPREGTKIDLRSATFVNADPNGSVVIGPLVQNSGRSYVSASVPSR